ncbi:MAG: hypothetical protein JNL32_16590, partial [Candidatus Kapabacteria bacterium]|nr:hypothetical protein [Candidatus Kapabacteria bacterium]
AEQLKIAFYGQVVVQEHQALPDSTLDSTMAWSRSAVQQIPPYLIANNKMNYKVNTVGKMDGTKVLNISAALKGEIAVVDKKLPIKIKASSVTGKGTSVIEAETGYTRSKETSMVQSIQMDVTPPQTNKTQTLKQVKTMKLSVKMMN